MKLEEEKINFEKTIFWIKFKKSFFFNIYFILHKTIIILMRQNEELSITKSKNKNNNILLLTYNFDNLDYYSFNKIEEFIKIGYDKAKKIIK